jgi:hypothetical protein
MPAKTIEELEKSLIISNKVINQRFGQYEESIKMVVNALNSNNELVNKLIEDNKKLEERLRMLENFAKQVIDSNKKADITLSVNKSEKANE